MNEIKIESITISLSNEGGNVRVKSDNESVILHNQSIDDVSNLIVHNFNLIFNHYKIMIGNGKKEFDFRDLTNVSISIVFYYLYMYNTWRIHYKKEENRNLKFIEKDFSNPSTHDILFSFFKTKYPHDWVKKCAVLLGMEEVDVFAYYKTREDYYNK